MGVINLPENVILKLTRVCTSDVGTFGVLSHANQPICVTLEEPWKDNKRGISCVPSGSYKCVEHTGSRFQHVWRLLDVPKREAVLIHNGNTLDDTEGCILVGDSFAKGAIMNSRKTLDLLRATLPKNFTININEKGL